MLLWLHGSQTNIVNKDLDSELQNNKISRNWNLYIKIYNKYT